MSAVTSASTAGSGSAPKGAPANPVRKYYGKYRAIVFNNVDPMMIGRLSVICPDASFLTPTTWCMPCVPLASPNAGMVALPAIGSGVWIEFEAGNPGKPIWVGCYWGLGAEVPVLSRIAPPLIPSITLQTTLKNGIVINDLAGPTGGVLIQSMTGAMISVSDTGIIISNGKGAVINMTGPAINIIGTPLDVNGGALTVTA
jgi:hypothetical protein